jgi:hypothetical protein
MEEDRLDLLARAIWDAIGPTVPGDQATEEGRELVRETHRKMYNERAAEMLCIPAAKACLKWLGIEDQVPREGGVGEMVEAGHALHSLACSLRSFLRCGERLGEKEEANTEIILATWRGIDAQFIGETEEAKAFLSEHHPDENGD